LLFILVFDFCFLSTSQEIGWEERLRNDLFCIELTRSINGAARDPVSESLRPGKLAGEACRILGFSLADRCPSRCWNTQKIQYFRRKL